MGAPTQKSVHLPEHLWSAFDEMSRDGVQSADALMELAVEQFVALQGYELPLAMPPLSLQDDDDQPLELARTRARPALDQPHPAPPPPSPVQPLPNITGIGPTYVRRESEPIEAAPAVTEPQPTLPHPAPLPAPVPSPAVPPRASPGPKAKPSSPPPKPAPPPQWATRGALSDGDEERTAARERIAVIDRELERLTRERPASTPLGRAAEEE
jgi:hypothetical protein